MNKEEYEQLQKQIQHEKTIIKKLTKTYDPQQQLHNTTIEYSKLIPIIIKQNANGKTRQMTKTNGEKIQTYEPTKYIQHLEQAIDEDESLDALIDILDKQKVDQEQNTVTITTPEQTTYYEAYQIIDYLLSEILRTTILEKDRVINIIIKTKKPKTKQTKLRR